MLRFFPTKGMINSEPALPAGRQHVTKLKIKKDT